jgi:hypothetical protein
MKTTLIFFMIVLLPVAAMICLPSCTPTGPAPVTSQTGATPTATDLTVTSADSPGLPSRGFFMGVLPVPAPGQSFEDSYRQIASCANFSPVWGRPTPFYDLAGELSGTWGQAFVTQYIRGNGMFPLVNLSFIGPEMTLVSPPGISGATLSDERWREAYRQAALDVVKAARPRYLSLGNEVNRWYEKYGVGGDNPDGFQHYVSLYQEIYDDVKALSPGTLVFCTFAREIVAENRAADMTVLRRFDPAKLDILVLTSYPYAVRGVKSPSDIPDDYYVAAAQYLPGKPLGFSEVAWPSLDYFGGEIAQADFLGQLTGRLTRGQGIDLRLLGWPWLCDLSAEDATGLKKQDGTPKAAYNAWRSLALLGSWKSRGESIPADAVKITPDKDSYPPVLHSAEYQSPVPLLAPVNTAGAEDSPFVLPDGRTLYFFFTPDVRVPVEKQLLDEVTGIYKTVKLADGRWREPERVVLDDDISLNGCTFVRDGIMWFCSARRGYTGVNWFTARLVDGQWQDWKYAGDLFPADFQVGELHITADGREVYFHSSRPGGLGGYDIWVTRNVDGKWQEPENIRAVNTPENEGWPYISGDGDELWFNRTYLGSPAVFRSKKVNGEWQEPEMIISQFAGEPSLDDAGNIYFVHHYYRDGVMLEADIYLAARK